MLTTPNPLVALAALAVLYVGVKIVYQLFVSPLRNVPGPLLAKLTPYYLILIDLAGHRTSTIHKLHKKYGTAVRVGPSEVSFSNIETVKEVYGQATPYMKAPWYEKMSRPPLGIFALTDRRAHSQRRKLLSHVFSQSNLLDTEPLIAKQILNLKKRIQSDSSAPQDMHVLFRLCSLDIIGELFLGKSFDALQDPSLRNYLHDIDLVFIIYGIESAFPWVTPILYMLPFAPVKHFLQAISRQQVYAQKNFHEYIERYGRNSGRKDLLTKLIAVKPEPGDDEALTDKAAWMEVNNLVFAGTDTTSTTLTYMFWELARYQDWQDRLRKELNNSLQSSGGGDDAMPTWHQVQDLPVLDAIINEALRLHPAAPASLPRSVPAGGRMIDGHFVPERTVVSMQCYTTQRNPEAFPDPEDFKPERWLDPEKVTDQMRELFMPFSKGTRACLGKNLAMMELKLTTATLIKAFKVQLAPSATEDCMSMTDHFLVIPKGGKCELMFGKVVGGSSKE